MLWGKPALLVQVTDSPLATVMVAGSKTKAPEVKTMRKMVVRR